MEVPYRKTPVPSGVRRDAEGRPRTEAPRLEPAGRTPGADPATRRRVLMTPSPWGLHPSCASTQVPNRSAAFESLAGRDVDSLRHQGLQRQGRGGARGRVHHSPAASAQLQTSGSGADDREARDAEPEHAPAHAHAHARETRSRNVDQGAVSRPSQGRRGPSVIAFRCTTPELCIRHFEAPGRSRRRRRRRHRNRGFRRQLGESPLEADEGTSRRDPLASAGGPSRRWTC